MTRFTFRPLHDLAPSSASRAMRRSAASLAALIVVTLLAGCQTPVRLMPTPVSFQTGDIDPFEQTGSRVLGNDVPVLYATNRGAVIEKPEPIHTILPSERLRMGVAHVRIGDETLDWDTLHRLSTSNDPDQRPIVTLDRLEPIASLGPERHSDGIARCPRLLCAGQQGARGESEPRTAHLRAWLQQHHARAAAQAAQLRHFTGRRMVVLAFLWPSAGSILRYLTDVATPTNRSSLRAADRVARRAYERRGDRRALV